MVREKNHPVLFLSVPPLVILYAGQLFDRNGAVTAAVVILVLFSLVLSAERFIPVRSFRLVRFVFFGFLLGFGMLVAIYHQSRPLITLAPRNRIAVLTCELVADPAPAGPDYYRSRVQTHVLQTISGDRFSATGNADVFFPANLVRQSLPGGLAHRPNRVRFRDQAPMAAGSQIIAKGSILTIPVKYQPENPGSVARFTVIPESIPATGEQWVSPLAGIRSRLRLSLMRMLYDWKESGGFLLALLSGNRDYIEPGLALAFRNAGLSHVLALSGMHLSIIGGIALGFGMGAGGRKFSIRFSLLVLCLFVWFAGNSPSLDRALIMALLAAFLRSSGIRTDMLSLLACSCLIQLCASPEHAHSPAFMLSYAALLGIILAGKWITVILEPWIPARVSTALSASIGAQLFTVPVVAVTFGVLSPAGIVAACVVSPFVTLYLAAGLFLVGLGGFFPRIAGLVLPAYNSLYRLISTIVYRFASFPRIVLKDLSAMLAAGILCFAGIVLLYVLHERTCARRAPDALFTGL